MMLWQNDRDNLARLLVRAWVTDLQDVPHFLVVTETEWIVQCEILEQHLFDILPPDEGQVPIQGENGNPLMFDVFGLG
jgi:hypothetical protein